MRYVVTGGSGYIGSRLVERLAERDDTERVLICDVRPPRAYRPKVEYRAPRCPRSRRAARDVLAAERPGRARPPGLRPQPDPRRARRCTRSTWAARPTSSRPPRARPWAHVLVTSSATAYGAFPDNPVPLTEDDPVRGVPDFEYARDKAESDRLCQLWALENPERTMTIVRPCIVFGPTVDNYILRPLDQAAVPGRLRRPRRAGPVRARGRRRRGARPAARGSARRRLQPRGRRHDDVAASAPT